MPPQATLVECSVIGPLRYGLPNDDRTVVRVGELESSRVAAAAGLTRLSSRRAPELGDSDGTDADHDIERLNPPFSGIWYHGGVMDGGEVFGPAPSFRCSPSCEIKEPANSLTGSDESTSTSYGSGFTSA